MRKMAFIIGAVLFCVSLGHSDDLSKRHYELVYDVPVLNPYIVHAMVCSGDPHCNDVYDHEERHEWFETVDQALSRLNTPFQSLAANVLGGSPDQFKPENLVGIYEVRQVRLEQHTIGNKVVSVQQTVEKTVPKQEWRVQP